MSRTNKFEEYWVKFQKKNDVFSLKYFVDQIEKNNFNPTENSEYHSGKYYGFSFCVGDGNKKEIIGTVEFDDEVEFQSFCEDYETITSTMDKTDFLKIESDSPAQFSICKCITTEREYPITLLKQQAKERFPEYQFGNITVYSAIKCVYKLSDENNQDCQYFESRYYSYDDRINIKYGYTHLETGFLVIINENELFVSKKEEVFELLNDLCLGEDELCGPVKKISL